MYFVILQLLASIVLLLWAVRMVRTAVERAYAAELKRALSLAERSRFIAAGIGAGLAVALQSSTAVAALASNFASTGLMSTATGLVLMLGAYLGSALVASILSFDLSFFLAPLIILGGTLFLRGTQRRSKQLGRLVLGIAFVLLSLQMVSEATAPWRESEVLGWVITYLSGDLWTSFIVAALITWVSYSSVASVLVIITFGTAGLIPFEVSAAFILGANLGGTFIAYSITKGGDVRSRRVAAAALAMRGGMALLVLVLFQVFGVHSLGLPGDVGQQSSLLHIAFNFGVLLFGLLLSGPVSRLAEHFIGEVTDATHTDVARLRATALVADPAGNVDAALASATRELLRMSEMVEVMLQPIMDIIKTGDRAAVRRVKEIEAGVDRANRAIKLYLSRLDWSSMDSSQTHRASDLSSFAISLEQAGDIVSRELLRIADQKVDRRLSFSTQGWDELVQLHDRVLSNMQLALNVLVSEDTESARRLVVEKDEVGALERASMESHFARLRSGNTSSFDTSELHLELIHALRRINSLFSGIAYSILSEQGELLDTRLTHKSG
ncbi:MULTISPECIES: Na/Pi cotransporter family protein [unclassified Devosia]|uniref:Na/Pi cotransporter family protein n=1 Tax=unclassified Devosia TaxID=196773 RepID=UPI00145E448B|nr:MULTISPECIES: Na/Pi cotransporter family protein [unclassified Devosia]MBJ6987438.1 Na/Pi cotransporter family protein [Devosia sp. MC521]QMW63604.1 Na/Pi cotransporter family protein [Devosia sp. MC521]